MKLPDYIDEMIDPNDPLALLLAREGSNEEAYQTAMQYRSGTVQVVLRTEIEECEERESDGTWIKRTRRLSSKTIIHHRSRS